MKLRRSFVLGITRLAPALALTSAFGAGCVAEAPDAGSDPADVITADEKALTEEALYMRQVYQQKGVDAGLGFMRVDLGDDKQYQFLVHRLRKSGHTQENSPTLFESVKRARAKHLAEPPTQPVLGGEPIAATSQALVGDPCGQFLSAPTTSDLTTSEIDPTTYLNCFSGDTFAYGYNDVAAYETDAAGSYLTPLAYDSVESYTGVTELASPTVASALAANVGKFHFADGITYVDDGLGNSYSTYISIKTVAVNRTPSIATTHPMKFRGGTTIRSCIKRGAYVGNGDCDYAAVDSSGTPSQTGTGIAKMVQDGSGAWVADSNPANRWFPANFDQFGTLYLPLAGTFDAGTDSNGADCTITSFATNNGGQGRSVISLQTGGWCLTSAPSGMNITDIGSALQLPGHTGSRTASYNVLGNFGPDCQSLIAGTAFTSKVKIVNTISAQTSCDTATSGPRTQSQVILNIDYRSSCMAKGTGVLRADGKYVAVEDIHMGDKVLSNDHGLALSVVSMTRGGEDHPLIRIVDDKGHNVLLTEAHPVITSDGILPAGAVRVGAGLQTDSGPAVVVDVENVRYGDAVYNLALGTPGELAQVSANDRTMFAGGIRVGDNEMQLDLAKKSRPAPRSEVASAWKNDYANAVVRSANIHQND